MKTFHFILAATLIAANSLHAQLVNDGATNTLSNITNTFTSDVTVGTNGSFTLLVLSDNALLTNSANGNIGLNATARSNEVQLTSSTARWRMGTSLLVGSNGSANWLVVSNGALVENFGAAVGFNPGSSNNSALVTGGGSIWTNRGTLTVGYSGRGNQLLVSNGGWLASRFGNVSLQSGSSNSLVVVSGNGSVWTNEFDLEFAYKDHSNRMIIEAGGVVYSDNGRIAAGGDLVFGTVPINNAVLVTGPGSLWTNRSAVGLNNALVGGFNQLIVSNGAAVVSGGTGAVGGTGNRAVITGPGSRWANQSDFTLGGSANQLEVSNGAGLVCSNATLGSLSLGGDDTVLVTGAGSFWTNSGHLTMGFANSVRAVVVASNGASASVGGNAIIGPGANANFNSVSVTDAGSTWLIASNLYVGSNGALNQLVVSNGARLNARAAFLGREASSSGNLATVTGAGSAWTNADSLFVGGFGNGNRLVINNGGIVRNIGGVIGLELSATNNEALVTDPGSLWANGGISVGSSGNRSRLVVSNSAVVAVAVAVTMGVVPSATNNRVIVDGGTLRATNFSGNGTLDVRRGTNVLNAGLIDVDQLLLTNIQGFFEFNGGKLITRGGVVSNSLPFVVGRGSSATPAIWDVRAGSISHLLATRLIVGSNSSFNQVFVTNGAVLDGKSDMFMAFTSGSNNVLTVKGTGSTLNSPLSMFIGADGDANRMVVADGGKVFANLGNAGTFIGRSVGTRSNSVVVADPNSQWSVNDVLYVGAGGNANQLVVSNGGIVSSLVGYVGSATSGSNNIATVTGAGSSWSNRSELYVGAGASGNRLFVTDGGSVVNADAFIGLNSSSRTNRVIVTGPGALWETRTNLYMGYDGSLSEIIISNNAVARVGGALFTGFTPNAGSNRITIASGALLVTNLAGNALLEIRRGTNVLNSGWVEADILRMTNGTGGRFELNGGTLSVKTSRVSIGNPFLVGDSVNPATFNLAGNGTHDFSGTLGLIVRSNATLTGNGSLVAQLQVLAGAQLSPGASIGKISLSTPPFFSGTVAMEITRNGTVSTNDQIQVTGTVTYGGALTVTNIGPNALVPGDNFKLFNATSYAGAFSSIILPPLDFGLSWTNKLLVDGSIQVLPGPALLMSGGSYTQNFNSLSGSGTLNPWRDNFTLLGWYAAQSLTPFGITNYRASDGSANSGDLYSFGSAGTGDRALGAIPVNAMGHVSYGLGFVNDTGNAVTNCTITYTGEQWRDSESGVTNTLSFWYRVSAAAITNTEPGIFTNWTEVTGSDFVSPTVLGVAAALNGNQATNRRVITSGFLAGIVVPPGHNIFFRWHDTNESGSDEGMAVDDLVVAFPLPVEKFWTNALGGNYEVASNWLANIVVSPIDIANFTNNANYQVTWSADAIAAKAVFNSQSGSVTQAVGSSAWNVTDAYTIGKDAATTSAVTHVSGALRVTNSLGDARMVIGESGRGNYTLSGGAVEVDNLFVTNGSASRFTLFSGSLKTRNTTFNQGTSFEVGNFFLTGTATLELLGGTHTFPNAVTVYPNATLKGNGSIAGSVFIMGLLSPGASIGQLAISRSLAFDFDSTSFFELNKAAGTNDNIVGLTNIQYQGSLIVTNLAGTLANGDRFPLFTSTRYFPSTFTNIVLPPLDPGLKWRNKLMMDGSLEVLTIPTRDFGVDVSHFQGASGISQASWDQMFAEGKRFTFIKATEGLTGPHDAAMSNNVERATAAGLLAGVYHFAHPENRPTTNGAIAEASNMVVYAGSAIGPGRLRPVLDIEGAATSLSVTALTDWVIAFCDEIIARRGPGAAPIIYCTQGSANIEFDSRLANYDLWLRTIGGSDPATDDPVGVLNLDPTGVFNEWSFWQYSDTGNSGGIAPLDLDVCHSEYKPLSSFLIPNSPPTPVQLIGATFITNGAFQFSFTNTPGALFTALATTNLSLPLSNWTVLGSVTEISPGQFEFSEQQPTNTAQRFYAVRSP